MSKLYRARSLLYRRQNLQENIRWKALDEIYKIYIFLHRSDLNISPKSRSSFPMLATENLNQHHLSQDCERDLSLVPMKRYFSAIFAMFMINVDEVLSYFREYFQKTIIWKTHGYLQRCLPNFACLIRKPNVLTCKTCKKTCTDVLRKMTSKAG